MTTEASRPWRSLVRAISYHTTVGSLRGILAFSSRVRVFHGENFPATGPVILASNHISHFDPPFLSAYSPRPVDWLAMSELYSTGWSNTYFRSVNAIPIRRGAPDRAALREAVARLQDGRVVGIFPEGGIRDGGASVLAGAPSQRGLSMLARLSQAPVLPCVILGSDRLYNIKNWKPWRRVPIWICLGEIIPPGLEESTFSERLTASFVTLREELLKAHGATTDDLPRSPKERMQAG
ncbi:MAG: lysophospholipid acyltransferase family protein [Terrimicrobiaceae bacterium]